MKYDTIQKVLGEGNFVLTLSEGHFGNAHNTFYDLFRVKNGKIAEHWDVIKPTLVKHYVLCISSSLTFLSDKSVSAVR